MQDKIGKNIHHSSAATNPVINNAARTALKPSMLVLALFLSACGAASKSSGLYSERVPFSVLVRLISLCISIEIKADGGSQAKAKTHHTSHCVVRDSSTLTLIPFMGIKKGMSRLTIALGEGCNPPGEGEAGRKDLPSLVEP